MHTSLLRRLSLVALLLIGSLSACKQNDPKPAPAPELASRLSSQYILKQVSVDGEVRSASDVDLKGGAKVVRVNDKSVNVELNVNFISDNEGFLNGSINDLTLTDAGNNSVDLAKGTEKMGQGNTDKLTLTFKGNETGRVIGLIMTK